MKLYLSDALHLHSNISNEEGQVLYRVQSTPKWWPKTSRITRRIDHPPSSRPPQISSWSSYEEDGNVDDPVTLVSKPFGMDAGTNPGRVGLNWHESSGSESDLWNKFAHLATIDYNLFASTKIRLRGEELQVQRWFRKGEKGHFGRDRIFTGPDGAEYKWTMGEKVPELFHRDTNELVATVIRPRVGFFKKSKPLTLEIFPNGEHMMDLIIVTFVYIERLRQDREED